MALAARARAASSCARLSSKGAQQELSVCGVVVPVQTVEVQEVALAVKACWSCA